MAQKKTVDLLKCLQEMEECKNSLNQESIMLEALIIRKEESIKEKMAELNRNLSQAEERKEQLQRKVKKLKEMKETFESEKQELDQVPYYSHMNCHYAKYSRGPSFNCLNMYLLL